ncbi:hypothetical protein CRUP_006429, partial [Coryphaenoides rupestris]
GLKVIDLQMPDFLRVLERAVQSGEPVLLQNVQEELDPALGPILNKAVTHTGGRMLLRLGDKEKDSLVLDIAAGKRTLQELEDEILRLLNEASGSLLDDVQLVNTLHSSKVTASRVAEQLETSEQTEGKIDMAREFQVVPLEGA